MTAMPLTATLRAFFVLTCIASAASSARAADLPANQWVPMNEPPAGVQCLGWDEMRYAPELDGVIFSGAYRSFTSENQNALWLYRFRENRWRLLHVNLFYTRDELASDGGHTTGCMLYDEARKVVVYKGLVSMSRNDRLRTWIFDPLALVGWDANPPSPVPPIDFDAASAYVPDLKAGLRYRAGAGVWAYDAVANRWKQIAPPGRGKDGGPPSTADGVYDAKRKRLICFGGSAGEYSGKSYTTFNDLWAFDVAAKTWQKLSPKNPPPPRGWPQIALSPAADSLLLTGGMTGDRSNNGNNKPCHDTWALNLETLEWESLIEKGSPVTANESNHLAYDPANDVFLFVAAPPKGLGYGYQCAMYAFKYQAKNAGTPKSPEKPAVAPPSAYDLKALPKADGEWVHLGGGSVTAVKGWAFRPALVSNGGELLLAFAEYDPPGKYNDEGCYVYAFKYAADGKWTRLGARAVSDAPAHSQCPAAAFDAAGKPVVAYQMLAPWKPGQIVVKRFDGDWKPAATAAFLPKTETQPALPALATLTGGPGGLAVAWQAHPNAGKGIGVYVDQIAKTGDDWSPLGDGKPLNAGNAGQTRGQFTSLAADPKGRPLLAWQEQKAGYEGQDATPERIHVRRLEDGKWGELGGEVPASTPETRAFSYAMTVHGGEPVVAVCEGTDGARAALIVRAWKDGQWVRLGDGPLNLLGPDGGALKPAADSDGGATKPAATSDSGALKPAMVSDGKSLYVAWPEFLPNRPPLLFVKKWDGAAWSLVGGPLNDAPGKGSVQHPALALLNGKPVLAWTEYALESNSWRQVFVKTLR